MNKMAANEILRNQLAPNVIMNDRWKIVEKVGEGNFGLVYVVEDLFEGERERILKVGKKRCERFGAESADLLCHEIRVIREVNESCADLKHISKLFGDGDFILNGLIFPFMVIQRFGQSLDRFLKTAGGKLSVRTTLKLGVGIVNALEEIHRLGWVHRDVKPSNFALQFGHEDSVNRDEIFHVFMLDFGRAKRFRDNAGKWTDRDNVCLFGGPLNYASIDAHKRKEHGPVDDLQSVLYVMSHFSTGFLPWLHMRNPWEVLWLKRASPNKLLYGNLPPEISEFQYYIASTAYGDMPNYNLLRQLLHIGRIDS